MNRDEHEHSHAGHGEIPWFKGDMQRALDAAKAQAKPLFVYWGAVWCPPCNVIKSTIFPNERVIRAASRFIPVYLDGDTEEAQSWGERLNASGYPTLMVLNSAGEEVARLAAAGTADEFADTLERLSRELAPIEALVEKALSAPAGEVPREHWKLITDYSWSQRSHLEEDPLRTSANFARLEEKVPAEMTVEKSRMHFLFIERKIEEDEAAKSKSWDKAFRERQAAWLSSVLSDTAAARANLQSLAYGASDFALWLYPQAGDARTAFVAAYIGTMERVRAAGGLSPYERLITDYPPIKFAGMEGGVALEESARAAIRDRVTTAIAAAADQKEHSFILNSGAYILRKAGFAKEAWDTLKANVSKAKAPYYVMSVLSEFDEEDGNMEGALEWAEKAYRASLGAATRLQWGTNYLSTLLKAHPKSKDEILAQVEKFYDEHLLAADAFMGRNKARMTRLSREAGEWASGHAAAPDLKALASKLRGRCDSDKVPASQSFRSSCRAYFDGFGKSGKA